jgi:hypothetical protein
LVAEHVERLFCVSEICFSSLKRLFGIGETLATTLVDLATSFAAKLSAYTYTYLVNRRLGRTQGRIKDLRT